MGSSASSNVGASRSHAAARALAAFVFRALLLLLPLAAAPYGSVEPWWTGLFDAFVFVLAAVWAIEGALAGRWLTRAHALLLLPCVALAALALLQSLPLPTVGVVSFDPYESRVFALRMLAFTLYAAMLLRYATTEGRLRALVVAVVCVGVASALFGLLRQAGQRDQVGFVLPLLRKGEGFAQFVSRNHFAYLAEMSLGLAAGLLPGRVLTWQKRMLCAAAAATLWAALVLSGSRGGIFALLCELLFVAAAFGATRPRAGTAEPKGSAARFANSGAGRALVAALLLVALVFGTVWVGGDPFAERVGSLREEGAAADAVRARRPAIWADTARLAFEHPLFGVGLGGYWIAIRTTHGGSGLMVPRQAHDEYLELFASAGVVGPLLLAWFLFLFVGRARVRLREGTPLTRAAALGALAGLFGVAVHSLVDFGLHVTANAFVCAALVALAAAEVEDGVQKTSRRKY